jgi:hypothetical protein
MKRWTRADKTACSRWQANQFQFFLHAGAYWAGARHAACDPEALALLGSSKVAPVTSYLTPPCPRP